MASGWPRRVVLGMMLAARVLALSPLSERLSSALWTRRLVTALRSQRWTALRTSSVPSMTADFSTEGPVTSPKPSNPTSSSKPNHSNTPRPLSSKVGAFHNWPIVHAGPVHYKRALKQTRVVRMDDKITNVRNAQRKFSAQSIDCLMKGLTVPITGILTLYKTSYRALHPYEATVANLTIASRVKLGHPDLPDLLTTLRTLRATTSRVAKDFASRASNASSSVEAKELLEQAQRELEDIYTYSKESHALQEVTLLHQALRSIPVLDLSLPTVVLVGMPNVGKSSLVRALSTALPEVNNYPFTTRGVTIGHIYECDQDVAETLHADPTDLLVKKLVAPTDLSVQEENEGDEVGEEASATQLHYKPPPKTNGAKLRRRFQVMDTPGLLDRTFEERNEMEQLTFASMLHLPTAVVFVMDITNTAGEQSTIDKQLRVRAALKERFPRRPWVDVISKSDAAKEHPHYRDVDLQSQLPPDALYVSVRSGENVNQLMAQVHSMLEYLESVLRDRG